MNIANRVASISMHSIMGDVDSNLDSIGDWMRKAQAHGSSITLFNEECITGSMNKSNLSFSQAKTVAEYASIKAIPFLESLCSELAMTVLVGTIEPAAERFSNSVLIVGPDGYLATFSKLHLPNKTEAEWFHSGSSLPVVTSQGWTFGVGICFDVRFPEIFRVAAQHGAELFFVAVGGSGHVDQIKPSGDQKHQAKFHVKEMMQLVSARSIDNGMYTFIANQSGKSGNAWFPGYCLAVAPNGKLIGEHSTGEEGMLITEITKQIVKKAKTSAECTVTAVRPDIYANPVIVE